MTQNKSRDEQAIRRARGQATTGNKYLDQAVFHYLRIGFEDGFEAAEKQYLGYVANLKEKIQKMKKAIDHGIECGECAEAIAEGYTICGECSIE